MSTTEQVLSDFIDAWNAGRRPRLRDYLERVPAGTQRDDLADQISSWLEIAPTPDYDAATRAEIRAEPVVQHIFESVGDDAGLWPQLVPRLRARRGWTVAQLAERLVVHLHLARDAEARTAAYVEQLERGELEPSRLSRRLLEALGTLLGASPGTLADAGGLPTMLRTPTMGSALMRADERPEAQFLEDIELLSRAAMRPAPKPMDDVDRLFLGGPEG
jgi:transcriptional regulator with XRE-family HTH domain